MIPEGKTRAGLIKALEWVGIDVRFNERSARMELQDAIAAAAGTPNWETSDDLRVRSAARSLRTHASTWGRKACRAAYSAAEKGGATYWMRSWMIAG